MLNVVPRKTFHNVFADHAEICIETISGETQFHVAKFNCDCNTDNIATPAELSAEVREACISAFYLTSATKITETDAHAFVETSSLRGPPSTS